MSTVADISVIVPIYNVVPYLYQCINSVVNQSMKNIEIILVNDYHYAPHRKAEFRAYPVEEII